jgi:hypothetical protein
MSESKSVLYSEANSMLRSCDSLCYQMLQFYAAFFAAVIAFGPSASLAPEHAAWLLVATSVMGYLLTARLRRNYTYFQEVCKSLEKALTDVAQERPQTYADAKLLGFDGRHGLAIIPTKWLYSIFYISGGVWALMQTPVGLALAQMVDALATTVLAWLR